MEHREMFSKKLLKLWYTFNLPPSPPPPSLPVKIRKLFAREIRELKQRRRQRERHKTIGLISKNNRFARAFYAFVHFFAVLC